MFDKFRESEGEMVEERREENINAEESIESTSSVESRSEIGIGELIGKRAKLEEAIDYVGLMIKNLRDNRTLLEKDIEEESVDIKNLKEKLQKVSEYIEEENRGIADLSIKRKQVEDEADQVGTIINTLRDRLSGIDRIIGDEGSRVKRMKESRDSLED
ncbi:MAG: transcriptional regulator [Nitrosopumilus sp.]|nr:transcriptional regulator [Nitrosopumilus sp.]